MSTIRFNPPLIAHRGASAHAPENTMAAFRCAAESGAKWIEFDVHLTHDGVPIIIHDDTFDRTTDGTGKIADTKWADVQKLDAGNWFDPKFKGERVPHLAEVLKLALERNLRPMIEIKPCEGRAMATTMVTLIEASKIWPRDDAPPVILSFDPEVLGIASKFQPHWPRGYSLEDWHDDWREEAAKVEAELISADAEWLTHERVNLFLRSSGSTLLAYTVNDPARAKELLSQGVAAIFCDDPSAMGAALK